ncbi:MAG TPA: hypothetical protein VGD45_28245 [Steroidobacter sp.]|uniref:hypothetical protein n=1 Tax=Steroidobacter sp. TaxID=1978227 RepID=UPI002EDBB34D
MNRILMQLSTALVLAVACVAATAQDTLPYKDGVVVLVTSVRTQPGKFNDYFRYLSGPFTQIMEEAKKQGIVTEYAFYGAQPQSPDDPDLYIVETYPNMATFDTITDKMSAISKKVFGSLKQADEADANREEIRKILGTQMIRKLEPVRTSTATE